MKSKEFIAYKDALIDYLRNFVKGLQKQGNRIEKLLKSIPSETIENVFAMIIQYEKSIPRLDIETTEADIEDNVRGRWKSIVDWFVGDGRSQSEVVRVLDLTNEIIRKITRYAARFAESRNSAASRKEEYKRMCHMFLHTDSIEEAHKLSATLFGVFHMQHIRGDIERETESITSSVYDEVATVVDIKPRVRTYRQKAERSFIEDKTERKGRLHREYIKSIIEEKQIMESYIQNNCIEISELPVISSNVRTTMLRWIGRALTAADNCAKTEDGRQYRLFWSKESVCILKSIDGQLEMPAFRLEFEEII